MFATLEIEQKILLTAVIITIIGLFLPWTTGQWLGAEADVGSSFALFTTTNAWLLLLGNFALLSTLHPTIIQKVWLNYTQRIHAIQLIISIACLLLMIAVSTTVYEMSNEASLLHTGFGMYVSLLSMTVSVMYSYILKINHDKDRSKPNFSHPNDNPSSPTFTPLH